MEGLNPRQHYAVQTTDGPVMIVAGPGTGTTHTLSHRLAYLLRQTRVPPANILAITFTRSAAGAMRERLKTLAPGAEAVWIDTFHAVAMRLLKEEGIPSKTFSIISEVDKPGFLEGLVERSARAAFLESLRQKKQKGIRPETESEKVYQERLRTSDYLDFDDLFLYVGELKSNWQNLFRYILVDEFQDTSAAQYRFLRQLAAEHLCVIGD